MSNEGNALSAERVEPAEREQGSSEGEDGCWSSALRRAWEGPCGLRELWTLALPLVISTASFTLMHFCDRLFLTWYSTRAMAAVMQAGVLTWTAISLPLGIATYATTFVAQYHGAGRHDRIGAVIWQASRLALYSFPLFLLSGLLIPHLFASFGHPPELLWLETVYYRIVAFGSPSAVLAAALSALFIGQGQTRVVMIIDVTASLVNVVLDYVAIFGYFGFPEMGLEGAAWATVIAMWVKALLYAVVIWRLPERQQYGFAAGRAFDGRLLLRLLRFGGPNGLQFLLEGSTFTMFMLFMGRIGTLATEATTLAVSVNLVAFVPVMGIAMAVTTLVGQQIGRRRPDLAVRATFSGLQVGIAYSGIFALSYWLVPDLFLVAHKLDSPEHQQLRELAVFLLRFVAIYCVVDAVQLILVSAIKGAGDTAFAVVVSVVMLAVLVGVGAAGAAMFTHQHRQITWWWGVLTAWVWLLAIAYGARFVQGRWKSMSVMESHPVPEPSGS